MNFNWQKRHLLESKKIRIIYTYSESELKQILAQTNELRGRVHLAQQQYQESLSTDVNNVDLILKLAELYREEGDTATALTYFERAKKLQPTDQLIQANIDQLKKKKISTDFTTIDFTNSKKVQEAVTILENERNYSKGIEILEKAVQSKNWDPELYYLLGKLQYADGKHQSSILSLNKALELSPYHYKSIRSLAYLHLHQKNFREAEALIAKHEPYFDQSAKYLSLSFQVYKHTGSKRDLYAILEKAILLDSLETDAYRALYQLGIEDNQYAVALNDFKKLIELGGGHNDSLDFYSRVEKQVKFMLEQHAYQGQAAGAEIIYKLDPLNFEFAYYYGLCAYMEGNYETAETAIRSFGKAIQSFTPSVQRAYYNLKAKINLETGHPDLSERLFAMGGDNLNPADYLGLAMAQFDQGKDWITNFRRAGEPLGYNEDALKRYEKMRKKAEKMGGSPGGAERMR
jgi:tetratricopeptide (TPR) repeat protein